MNEKNENQVKELSKEEMANVRGGLVAGLGSTFVTGGPDVVDFRESATDSDLFRPRV
jgi:hypothetical protein